MTLMERLDELRGENKDLLDKRRVISNPDAREVYTNVIERNRKRIQELLEEHWRTLP